MAGDHLELDGVVVKAQGNGLFKVETVQGKNVIPCTLSGKINKNSIHIVEGDKVKIKVSPYDLNRGIIVYRSK